VRSPGRSPRLMLMRLRAHHLEAGATYRNCTSRSRKSTFHTARGGGGLVWSGLGGLVAPPRYAFGARPPGLRVTRKSRLGLRISISGSESL
jgi:hypothetical protein